MVIRELVTLLRYQLQKSGVREYQEAGTQAAKAIQAEADKASRALRRLAGGLLAAFSFGKLVEYADTWNEMNDRIELATSSQEEATAVMKELEAIARRSRSPLEQVASAWLENVRSLQDLGATTDESLQFTEALNTGLDLSAIRGQRAAMVSMALARAMDIGTLRGHNLNTIIQSGGKLAEALAAELGVMVAGLHEAGAAGKITGEVIKRALINQLPGWRAELEKGTVSFRDGLDNIRNGMLSFIGNTDRAYAVSSALGRIMLWVGDNIQAMVVAAGLIAGSFALGKLLVGFKAVGSAIKAIRDGWIAAAAAQFVALWPVYLIAGLLLLAALAVQDIITWLNGGDSVLGRLVGSSEEWKEQIDAVVRPAKRVWDRLTQIAEKIGEAVTGIGNFGRDVFGLEGRFENVGGVIRSAFGGALRMVSLLLHGIDAALAGIIWAIEFVLGGITKIANAMPELAVETPALGGRASVLGNPMLQAMRPFGMMASASVSVVQYITGTRDPEETANVVERRLDDAARRGLPSAEAAP